jgi:palmitoyltransferase
MAGFGDSAITQQIAVPAVCLLISFLGYYSQYAFRNGTVSPGPPSRSETILFNTLLAMLWYTYYKTVTVDPGRYEFKEAVIEQKEGVRWCNKCAAPKPPRAHHCRHCERCIPKMDHHCPWTRNCVSMTTFPHFMRFLIYANASLWTLSYLLWQRLAALWQDRHLPAYLGPNLHGLVSLALVSIICFFTSFALGIMLFTTAKSWIFNQTMIEGWEQDRHEAIAERGGRDWWDVTGPDGKLRFEKVEFPYDIDIFTNMAQAMGTALFPLWLWPFAGNPCVAPAPADGNYKGTGWTWEENGFNRHDGMWPPPDPEKLRRAAKGLHTRRRDYDSELRDLDRNLAPEAVKRRQDEDARRRRKMALAELEEVDYDDYDELYDDDEARYSDDDNENGSRERQEWENEEGEKLRDYGVDDEDEDDMRPLVPQLDAEEDIPLGELLRRRKALQKDGEK